MKEIWINLELYFESYDFYNFKGFFRIFYEFIFDLNLIKIIKINAKSGLFPRRATWMRRGSATRAHAVYYTLLFYIYSI